MAAQSWRVRHVVQQTLREEDQRLLQTKFGMERIPPCVRCIATSIGPPASSNVNETERKCTGTSTPRTCAGGSGSTFWWIPWSPPGVQGWYKANPAILRKLTRDDNVPPLCAARTTEKKLRRKTYLAAKMLVRGPPQKKDWRRRRIFGTLNCNYPLSNSGIYQNGQAQQDCAMAAGSKNVAVWVCGRRQVDDRRSWMRKGKRELIVSLTSRKCTMHDGMDSLDLEKATELRICLACWAMKSGTQQLFFSPEAKHSWKWNTDCVQ